MLFKKLKRKKRKSKVPAIKTRMLMSRVRFRTAATPLKIIGGIPTATAASANHWKGAKKYFKNESPSNIPLPIANGLGHFFW